jgi:hypothetical protein
MPEQQVNIGIVMAPLQDGSGAVVGINLFGIYQTQFTIPRGIIVEFLKAWVANEKQVADIARIVTKEKLHA